MAFLWEGIIEQVHIGNVWSTVYSNSSSNSPILEVEVIPCFPKLPITVSAPPQNCTKGDLHSLELTLRCMEEQIGDLTIQIRMIRGEKSGKEWIFEG